MIDIEQILGAGAIPSLTPAPSKQAYISTGFIGLDSVLGGGIPEGSIIEIAGEPSSGKTTLMLGLMTDKESVYINTDYDFDEYYAQLNGLDESLIVMYPNYANSIFYTIEMLMRRNFPLVVIDSASGIVSENDEVRSQEFQQYMSIIRNINSKTVIIFTNQLRYNGSRTVAADGMAVRKNVDIRMRIKQARKIEDCNHYELSITHNKFNPNPAYIRLVQYIGQGLSKEYNLLDYAIATGVMTNNGGHIRIKGNNGEFQNIGHGYDHVVSEITKYPKLRNIIMEALK